MNSIHFSIRHTIRLVLASLVIMLGVLSVKPAHAASITVNTTSDVLNGTDGKCSLREAIRAANNNTASGSAAGECPAGNASSLDAIFLTGGATYTLTNSTAGSLNVLDNPSAAYDVWLSVPLGGFAASIVQNASTDDRVMEVESGANVQVVGVSFRDGGNINYGAGILNQGTLMLTNCRIESNTAMVSAGGISNSGTLTLTNSFINNNSAPFGNGGGIANSGTLTLNGSIVYDNYALTKGGGIFNKNNGDVIIDTSTIRDNIVSNSGGDARGGGLYNDNTSTMTIRNGSMISGNYASSLSYGGAGGGIYNEGILDITDSTITNNDAGSHGGGIAISDGSVTIAGSIISYNTAESAGGITNDGYDSHLTITGSAILNNVAQTYGGAIRNGTNTANAMQITSSCIVGNSTATVLAVFNYAFASQSASGNWWGAANGPSGSSPGSGDAVGSNIDYSGWLTSPPDICP